MRQDLVKKDIDAIIDRIGDGENLILIARDYNLSVSGILKILTKEDYKSLYEGALIASAHTYADKGEQVLKDAERDKVEIIRARELAQHYRWMAGKRNPRKYGDKIDVTSDGEKVNQTIIIQGKKYADNAE